MVFSQFFIPIEALASPNASATSGSRSLTTSFSTQSHQLWPVKVVSDRHRKWRGWRLIGGSDKPKQHETTSRIFWEPSPRLTSFYTISTYKIQVLDVRGRQHSFLFYHGWGETFRTFTRDAIWHNKFSSTHFCRLQTDEIPNPLECFHEFTDKSAS